MDLLPCSNSSSVSRFLRDWDTSSAQRRVRILRQFVACCQHKTATDLEQMFAGAASLFFTRLTAWIRITYLSGKYLGDQLQAINVFLSSTASQTYLREFLEVGCVQTLLELVSVKQAKEADKIEALNVLYSVADSGRKYKEHICECYGIRAVAECMVRSNSEEMCELGRRLLYCLAEANPRFTVTVYKALVALFACDLPLVQRLAACTVRRLQSTVGTVIFSILDPLYQLLKSLSVEVQVEASELILELIHYDDKGYMLSGLVQLLTPSADEIDKDSIITADELSRSQPLSVYVQQSAAARCIGKLVLQCGPPVINKLIDLNVVEKLLHAIANTEYPVSQREAAVALSRMCYGGSDEALNINDRLATTVGQHLHQLIVTEPEEIYNKLTATHIDILLAERP